MLFCLGRNGRNVKSSMSSRVLRKVQSRRHDMLTTQQCGASTGVSERPHSIEAYRDDISQKSHHWEFMIIAGESPYLALALEVDCVKLSTRTTTDKLIYAVEFHS